MSVHTYVSVRVQRNSFRFSNYNWFSLEVILLSSLIHAVRNLYGETPLGTAFRTDNKELIDLLDEEHLLPRYNDQELETSIVDVRDTYVCSQSLHKIIKQYLHVTRSLVSLNSVMNLIGFATSVYIGQY